MKYLDLKKFKENIVVICIFLGVILAFYFYLFKEFTPVFGINDDWTVYMVLSGSYLGEPDPYVLFFLYPLAWLICKLYELTTAIPWYGLLLHGCFILSGFWIFIRCYTRIKAKRLIIAVSALVIFLFSCIRMLVAIQYTHAATVCGAAAIFCFITADTKNADWKKYLWANIPTIFMAALALSIRQNAAFMCLPVAGMLFLAKWFVEEKKIDVDIIKKHGIFCIALIGVLGTLLLTHKIAYSSELWSEYADINYYREKVVDFYGTLSYEEMEDVAEEIGMSEDEYRLREIMLPFYNADMPYSEFLETMMERSKEKYDLEHPFEVRFQEANEKIIYYLQEESTSPQNFIFVILFVAVCIWLIYVKEWRGFIFMAAYLFGRFFAWYFVLFNGRFPLRIPQCLFAIDILAVIGIWLYFIQQEEKKTVNRVLEKICTIAFAGSILISCYKGVETTKVSEAYVEAFQDRWYGVKEYCMQRPENVYLLNGGSNTLFYFSDNILDTNTIGQPQNYYAISNFYSMSPNGFKKTEVSPGGNMAEELLEKDNVYWIYEKGSFSEEMFLHQYYKKYYETFKCELVDTFSTETSTFEVYFLGK